MSVLSGLAWEKCLQIFSFFTVYFLPTRYRVLYDNLVSLVYDTYTSHVKNTVPIIDHFEEEVIRWIPSSVYYRKLSDNESD